MFITESMAREVFREMAHTNIPYPEVGVTNAGEFICTAIAELARRNRDLENRIAALEDARHE